MASLTITAWRDGAIGFTGWDSHIRSELKRRLKRGVNASPDTLRTYAHRILGRELLTLEGVKDEAVTSLRQILETYGAEVLAGQVT